MLLNLVSLIRCYFCGIFCSLIEKVKGTGQVIQWSIDYNTIKDYKSSGGLSVPGVLYSTVRNHHRVSPQLSQPIYAEMNAH
jgi:hypothetical protein